MLSSNFFLGQRGATFLSDSGAGQPLGWCGTSAGRGQESARHGPMRCCGKGHLLGLLGLARAKGSLSGWGRELRRWGAVLG